MGCRGKGLIMNDYTIRRAERDDIPAVSRLLYQVQKVHSDARPDLFRAGGRKYTDDQLEGIFSDENTPVFVCVKDGCMVGYAFCIHRQIKDSTSLTDIKTLYIDDLCVDGAARGAHIGRALYDYVVGYARECGCYNVTLNVWADNTDAVGFYEHIGMKVQRIGMEKLL